MCRPLQECPLTEKSVHKRPINRKRLRSYVLIEEHKDHVFDFIMVNKRVSQRGNSQSYFTHCHYTHISPTDPGPSGHLKQLWYRGQMKYIYISTFLDGLLVE